MTKFIYFDTETSGFKPGQIGQLSMIIEENGSFKGINYFFEIDYIHPDAEALLGRGLDFYREQSQGIRFKDKADEIKNILCDSYYVAHNLKFDENFISTELWRCGIAIKPLGRLDTMEHYRDILNIPGKYGRVKNPNLGELVSYLDLDKEKVKTYAIKLFGSEDIDFHDARFDSTVVCIASHVAKELTKPDNERYWLNTFKAGV